MRRTNSRYLLFYAGVRRQHQGSQPLLQVGVRAAVCGHRWRRHLLRHERAEQEREEERQEEEVIS